jgi:integrase
MEINFTKKAIEALPVPERRSFHYDKQTAGLGLMTQPTGHKAFFWYRKIRGRPTWRHIGDFPELSVENARDAATELNSRLAKWKAGGYEGQSPFQKARALATTQTVGELADRYIEEQVRMRSTNPARAAREVRQAVDLYLARWKPRRLGDVTRAEVVRWHHELGKDGRRVTANRAWQLLRTMYNWAIKKEVWVGSNPARVMRDDLFEERSRERYLLEGEAPAFFRELNGEPDADLRDFLWLALFTGARKGDVLAMRWDQLGAGKWTVPNRKKPDRPYSVALVPEAAAVLRSRQGNGSEWVFPSRGRTGHLATLKRRWKRFLKRAGLDGLRIHDLRRTLGSWQANRGVSLEFIAQSLGHRDLRSTRVYARLQEGSARPGVEDATRAMLAASRRKPLPAPRKKK